MWKGSMSLGKVGWHYRKNESSICSIWDKEHEISFCWEVSVYTAVNYVTVMLST
jgi:hypothetical protein